MKRNIVMLYLIALHVMCVAAIWKPGWIDYQKAKYGFAVPGEQHILAVRAIHARDDDHVPAGAAIFLGDSITEGMRVGTVVPGAVNYGIGYQTSAQLVESMRNYQSLSRAGVIHLNIGTNDARDGTTRNLPQNYRKILAALPAAMPLVWSAIIPRLESDRPRIQEANRIAAKLCAERPRCTFVDTWKVLADANGSARPALYADPVHLNAKGYALWFELLRPAFASIG